MAKDEEKAVAPGAVTPPKMRRGSSKAAFTDELLTAFTDGLGGLEDGQVFSDNVAYPTRAAATATAGRLKRAVVDFEGSSYKSTDELTMRVWPAPANEDGNPKGEHVFGLGVKSEG